MLNTHDNIKLLRSFFSELFKFFQMFLFLSTYTITPRLFSPLQLKHRYPPHKHILLHEADLHYWHYARHLDGPQDYLSSKQILVKEKHRTDIPMLQSFHHDKLLVFV